MKLTLGLPIASFCLAIWLCGALAFSIGWGKSTQGMLDDLWGSLALLIAMGMTSIALITSLIMIQEEVEVPGRDFDCSQYPRIHVSGVVLYA